MKFFSSANHKVLSYWKRFNIFPELLKAVINSKTVKGDCDKVVDYEVFLLFFWVISVRKSFKTEKAASDCHLLLLL